MPDPKDENAGPEAAHKSIRTLRNEAAAQVEADAVQAGLRDAEAAPAPRKAKARKKPAPRARVAAKRRKGR